MNEWGFAGEIKSWWDAEFDLHAEWGLSACRVEHNMEGSLKRGDLVILNDHNQPVFAMELRLPDHANPSPLHMANLGDAHSKASLLGAKWAATSDGATLALIDAEASGPLMGRIKSTMSLAAPATREGLDNHSVHQQVKSAWIDLIQRLAPVIQGQQAILTQTPDAFFVESLRSLLARPVAEIRDSITVEKTTKTAFKDDLVRWMVDQQGWPHSESDFAQEIQRVAQVSAYVFTTRLLFYEALRRAQPSLDEISLPPSAAVNPTRRLVEGLFEEARNVSGDYETVFTWDEICKYALISKPAIEGWQRVLEHLGHFEIDKVGYDVLGQLFERLIDPHERYEWGQHYTAPDVVDLMLALALPDGRGFVMDPAVGGGTFLVRGYVRKRALDSTQSHQDRLEELIGCDQSAFAASIATISLASRDLSLGDNYPRVTASSFFKKAPGLSFMQLPIGPQTAENPVSQPVVLPEVRAVVCNPPYVGYNNIGRWRIDEAERALQSGPAGWPRNLAKKFNYHLFFWLHGASFLEDDGRLVFITSGEWLDSDYGSQLQNWLLVNTHVEIVIESLSEPWFSEARVGTVVMSARRRTPSDPATFNEATRFVTLRKPLRTLFGCFDQETEADHISHVDWFRDTLLTLTGWGESADYDYSVVPQSDLYHLGLR